MRLPNGRLSLELLPPPNAPWGLLIHFAGSFDGYRELKEDPALGGRDPMEFGNDCYELFQASGSLPPSLGWLRGVLFVESRRAKFDEDMGEDPNRMRYIHALVEGIRELVLRGRDS
jgi:hypothetical protein